MRKLWMGMAGVVFAVAAASQACAATTISDPAQFVRALFARMASSTTSKPPPEDIYSARLTALMVLDRREAGGEVGRLDFDIWTGAQDWQLSNVKVRAVDVESAKNRRIVVAAFRNEGKPHEMHYYFERGKTGWKLDDVRSAGQAASEQWTLSLILKYGWADASQ